MKELKELTSWDFPDKSMVPDGYDMITVADATRDNFDVLIDEHNKVVERVNELMNIMNFKPEVD